MRINTGFFRAVWHVKTLSLTRAWIDRILSLPPLGKRQVAVVFCLAKSSALTIPCLASISVDPESSEGTWSCWDVSWRSWGRTEVWLCVLEKKLEKTLRKELVSFCVSSQTSHEKCFLSLLQVVFSPQEHFGFICLGLDILSSGGVRRWEEILLQCLQSWTFWSSQRQHVFPETAYSKRIRFERHGGKKGFQLIRPVILGTAVLFLFSFVQPVFGLVFRK